MIVYYCLLLFTFLLQKFALLIVYASKFNA